LALAYNYQAKGLALPLACEQLPLAFEHLPLAF